MSILLYLSRLIDRLNLLVGRVVCWLVLIMTLIGSGNAITRHFNLSSNAWLEIQWYLFSAVFLLYSGYTLLKNGHIRIDIISSRFSKRTQVIMDIIGDLFFLFPMAALIIWLSWPLFISTYLSGETSSDAGGLIRWPLRILIPVGFSLLLLQGFSQLIKRIAFLMGRGPHPTVSTETGA